MFFDAHFHYAVSVDRGVFNIHNGGIKEAGDWMALSCAHTPSEWLLQSKSPSYIFRAFGIHPQTVGNIDIEMYKDFLKGLAETGQLHAIGEAGFDFFSDEFKATREIQEDVWNFQLSLAIKFGLPIVVHCRKGNELLFRDAALLKKVPVVLFHSFMGSFVEASSLIKRGINCFFSFGKQMMNNNKKVIDCVKNLPLENLLMETDGPFQTLKGEDNTMTSDIVLIYKAGYALRYGDYYESGGVDWKNIEAEGECKNKRDRRWLAYDEFCGRLAENGMKLVKGV